MLYQYKTCSAAEGGLIASDGPVNVSANGEYETPHGASPTAAGTYRSEERRVGKEYKTQAAPGCADEPVVIGPAQPSIETTQNPDHGIVGDTFKDKAKLSSAYGFGE